MKSKPQLTPVVSFRGDAGLLARIDQARASLEMSRGDFAREVVVAHFYKQEITDELLANLADFRQSLDEMNQSMQNISANYKRSLFILLTTIGQKTPEQAKEIVKNQLRS